MKTSRVLILSALTILPSGIICSAKSEKDQQKEIEQYFLNRLETDDTQAYTGGDILTANGLESAKKMVWDAWKEANKRYDEEKVDFNELRALSEADSCALNIPADLEKDAVMSYYFGSKGDKPDDGYPFFIYTHGSGPRDREWATGLRICSEFADTPSVYFIPRIPNEGEYYRWWQKGKQYVWEKLLRQAMISENVNPDRIYIFGISEGGYGSQRLASYYADYIAGGGPMAGGEPIQNAPAENLGNIAFSLRTGAEDRGFYRETLTRYAGNDLDSLASLYPGRYEHWVELIPGKGHSIDYRPTTPWLSKYSRKALPKEVIWENFEMDGKKRKGFYNLAVEEPGDEPRRYRYDLIIDGQNINLRVNTVEYSVTERDPQWGIPLRFARTYEKAECGKVTIYLSPELVNLNEPVIVNVNDKEVFKGKPEMRLDNLVNSCALFYDPHRLFPASITVEL